MLIPNYLGLNLVLYCQNFQQIYKFRLSGYSIDFGSAMIDFSFRPMSEYYLKTADCWS